LENRNSSADALWADHISLINIAAVVRCLQGVMLAGSDKLSESPSSVAQDHQASGPVSTQTFLSLPNLTFPPQVELNTHLKNEFTICHTRSLQGLQKSAPVTK